MTELVKVARLLSPALPGRMMIAPPSVTNPAWMLFDGPIDAIIRQYDGGVCTYVVRGPDGKALRHGVAGELAAALHNAVKLVRAFTRRRALHKPA